MDSHDSILLIEMTSNYPKNLGPFMYNLLCSWVGHFIGVSCTTCNWGLFVLGYVPPWHNSKAPYCYSILQNDLSYSTPRLVILPLWFLYGFWVVRVPYNSKIIRIKYIHWKSGAKKQGNKKAWFMYTIANRDPTLKSSHEALNVPNYTRKGPTTSHMAQGGEAVDFDQSYCKKPRIRPLDH